MCSLFSRGKTLGRQVVEIRVCACPGRDRKSDEKLVNGEPSSSQGGKRSKKGILHQFPTRIDTESCGAGLAEATLWYKNLKLLKSPLHKYISVHLDPIYSPKFWVGVCHTVLKTLTLFQTKIHYFPFSDHLKQPLIVLSVPMTFCRGFFSFSICFEDECPWSMSK